MKKRSEDGHNMGPLSNLKLLFLVWNFIEKRVKQWKIKLLLCRDALCFVQTPQPQVLRTALELFVEPERQIGQRVGQSLETKLLSCDCIFGREIKKIQTLLLTSLAFSRHSGEPLLLTVVSWGTRQAAVQTLSHGLWVVVSTRTGKLSSMSCTWACDATNNAMSVFLML